VIFPIGVALSKPRRSEGAHGQTRVSAEPAVLEGGPAEVEQGDCGELATNASVWADASTGPGEKAYPNLTYFNKVDKGGHFAAWEEPQLFSEEVRAAFRSLR
jgi:pimeloyl-ACP methyl ester carboxylesterase